MTAEIIIRIVYLIARIAFSTLCIRDAVLGFRKGDYWSFGFSITMVFVVWVYIARDIFS